MHRAHKTCTKRASKQRGACTVSLRAHQLYRKRDYCDAMCQKTADTRSVNHITKLLRADQSINLWDNRSVKAETSTKTTATFSSTKLTESSKTNPKM